MPFEMENNLNDESNLRQVHVKFIVGQIIFRIKILLTSLRRQLINKKLQISFVS